MERMLASVQEISAIKPIEGADKICSYKVKGWNVIDSINKYKVGDFVIYCEVDSWIPNTIAPFLSKDKEPKEFNGIKGERLRTVKLRGTISQGLLLPITVLEDYFHLKVGDDVSENLGIEKYEPPIPACLSGVAKGLFPSFIPKTDAERIQNVEMNDYVNHNYEISEKMDGSSGTFYWFGNEFNVCSRNLNIVYSEGNTFWKVAIKNNLEEKLKTLGLSIALQGEVVGPGIQKNIYKLTDHELYIFNVYDIEKGEYFSSEERTLLCEELRLKHVPIVHNVYVTNPSIDYWLEFAEGKSLINPSIEREGLVFKRLDDSSINFKCISNKFLLKNE